MARTPRVLIDSFFSSRHSRSALAALGLLGLLAACGGSSSQKLCIPISCGTGGACGETNDGCGKLLQCPDCVDGKADLGVAWSTVPTWAYNTTVTFSLTVTNAGPGSGASAKLSYPLPPQLTATWTCVAEGGAACPSAAGSSGLLGVEILRLPGGGKLVYTFTARVIGTVGTPITNLAQVQDGFYPDPNPSNDSATLAATVAQNPNAPTIASISGDTMARQGSSGLSLTVVGTHLETVTSATLGSIPGVAIASQTPSQLTVSFSVPHGVALDALSHAAVFSLQLAAADGVATQVGALTVTAITASPTGSGGAKGTFDAPLPSLTAALAAAAEGDTVLLKGGTYSAETWPTAPSGTPLSLAVTITGDAGAVPVLNGAAGKAAFIVTGNATLANLNIQGFTGANAAGVMIRGGTVVLSNVFAHGNQVGVDIRDAQVTIGGGSRISGNSAYGLATCGSGAVTVEDGVTISSSTNGISDGAPGCSGATRTLAVGAVAITGNSGAGIWVDQGGSGSINVDGAQLSSNGIGLRHAAKATTAVSVLGGSITGNTNNGVTFSGAGSLTVNGTEIGSNTVRNIDYQGSGTMVVRNLTNAWSGSGHNLDLRGVTGPTNPGGGSVTVTTSQISVPAACAGASGAVEISGGFTKLELSADVFHYTTASSTCAAIRDKRTQDDTNVSIAGSTFDLNGVAYVPVAGNCSSQVANQAGYTPLWGIAGPSNLFTPCP